MYNVTSLPIITIILERRQEEERFFVSISLFSDNGAASRERRGFNFLVFTKASDLRCCRKLGHPEPYNLDRYARKSPTRDRASFTPRLSTPSPEARLTAGRSIIYFVYLIARDDARTNPPWTHRGLRSFRRRTGNETGRRESKNINETWLLRNGGT